jgi:DNA-binding NarL/FixJ family response regulator
MIFFAEPKILAVGLNNKEMALRDLPIRLVSCASGSEAAEFLKEENVSSIICEWDLDDMPDGQFVRRLRVVKPDIKTIVLVRSKDTSGEIKARSIGASVVLTDETSDQMFRRAVIETNKLPRTTMYERIKK